jgi:acetyltransferase-like isoleucine patch superfamily enzyme
MYEVNATIEDGARLGSHVRIGAYAIVERGAVIGDRVAIGEHAIIRAGVIIGEGTAIGAGCIIEGSAEIGEHCVLHPYALLCGHPEGPTIQIGRNVVLRGHTIVYHDVVIEDQVTVGQYTFIRPGAIIREGVSLGSHNQIEGICEIGRQTRFHSNVHISMYSRIGSHCFIAPGFVPTNTPFPLSKFPDQSIQGVTVEDYVKIGANVTTAPGVTIGSNSLVGIGSVVVRDIPPNVFAMGNPCVVKRGIEELRYLDGSQEAPYERKES